MMSSAADVRRDARVACVEDVSFLLERVFQVRVPSGLEECVLAPERVALAVAIGDQIAVAHGLAVWFSLRGLVKHVAIDRGAPRTLPATPSLAWLFPEVGAVELNAPARRADVLIVPISKNVKLYDARG